MKKIPTLFIRDFKKHEIAGIRDQVSKPELKVVLEGECIPTLKMDGSCCAFFDNKFWKRRDIKKNKKGIYKNVPLGCIACCDPDPKTNHWPHWEPVREDDPSAKWFLEAKKNFLEGGGILKEGTYEAIGPHFQANHYKLKKDTLYRHGKDILDLKEFSFEGIKNFLKENEIEGIVFWKDGEPLCKIKRTDFGFPWK